MTQRHDTSVIWFALLVAIVATISIDLRFLFEDSASVSSNRVAAQSEWKLRAVKDGGLQFLDAEYQTVTSEIRERVQNEHLLFALKFALIGGILYAAMQRAASSKEVQLARTSFTALVVWAAVLVAALVDLRIAANQEVIGTLGRWVRRYEELKLGFPAVALGWEAFLADSRVHTTLRFSSQVLTALMFALSGGLFLVRRGRSNHPTVALLTGTCAVASIVLMTIAAARLKIAGGAFVLYAILGVAGSILAGLLAYGTYGGHVESTGSAGDDDVSPTPSSA